MPVIQINYDLKKQKDYPSLIKEIKDLGPWCHALESCWLVYTRLNAVQVRDRLLRVIDGDDALLVNAVSMSDSAAWYNLKPDVSNWLKKFLTPAYA
jgi:hypothetical protein